MAKDSVTNKFSVSNPPKQKDRSDKEKTTARPARDSRASKKPAQIVKDDNPSGALARTPFGSKDFEALFLQKKENVDVDKFDDVLAAIDWYLECEAKIVKFKIENDSLRAYRRGVLIGQVKRGHGDGTALVDLIRPQFFLKKEDIAHHVVKNGQAIIISKSGRKITVSKDGSVKA